MSHKRVKIGAYEPAGYREDGGEWPILIDGEYVGEIVKVMERTDQYSGDWKIAQYDVSIEGVDTRVFGVRRFKRYLLTGKWVGEYETARDALKAAKQFVHDNA